MTIKEPSKKLNRRPPKRSTGKEQLMLICTCTFWKLKADSDGTQLFSMRQRYKNVTTRFVRVNQTFNLLPTVAYDAKKAYDTRGRRRQAT